MMRELHALLLVLALVVVAPPTVVGAERGADVHGMADAFAAPGVALAWGVLRGPDEARTTVVLRVAADPGAYPSVAIAGRDPFSGREQLLRPAQTTTGTFDWRVSRPHFAELPRTELRFYATVRPDASAPPDLVVYYLGVPDTTPEFTMPDRLDAYLAERIARLRESAGGKSR